MVEMRGLLQSEVVLVCAIDLFTGAVLLEKLVQPSGRVRDWRSQIHGITEATLNAAVEQGNALAGWMEARAELWKIIDQNTVLVGHALQHDLDVLRMVHTRVVDSAILARNAVGLSSPQWGLQRLCKELVGLEIRDNTGGVHDCLEDVLATREVVLLCMQKKAKLETWAKAQRVAELARKEKQKKASREKAAKAKAAEARKARLESSTRSCHDCGIDHGSSYEDFSLEAMAEEFGWPSGYDPWSD
jgi:DNA polymerase III epsilon subunit-like protein